MEEGGTEVGGEGDYVYLSLHCHHQNDSCIKMGSDESHSEVFIDCEGQSHKTVLWTDFRKGLYMEDFRSDRVWLSWGDPVRLTVC